MKTYTDSLEDDEVEIGLEIMVSLGPTGYIGTEAVRQTLESWLASVDSKDLKNRKLKVAFKLL